MALQWVPEMKAYCPRVPYVIVGCKSDLREDAARIQEMNEKGQTFVAAMFEAGLVDGVITPVISRPGSVACFAAAFCFIDFSIIDSFWASVL